MSAPPRVLPPSKVPPVSCTTWQVGKKEKGVVSPSSNKKGDARNIDNSTNSTTLEGDKLTRKESGEKCIIVLSVYNDVLRSSITIAPILISLGSFQCISLLWIKR